MTDPNEGAPDFKDRSLGLGCFGGLSIVMGLLCALLVPLSLLALVLAKSVETGVDARSAVASSVLYAVIAVIFVWLGIGSIRARRWARELLLSLSWIWLLTGICSLVVGAFVLPQVMRAAAAESGLPPEGVLIVNLIVLGFGGIFYGVLPGAFVLFYRSPHVVATCRARHPEPEWIDSVPRQLVTLFVVWVLAAISVLLMPAYNFLFPFFGVVVTGFAGAVLWALVLAACVALAVGSSRRAPWAWWAGMGLSIAGGLSSSLTVLRLEYADLLALLNLPREQEALMATMSVPEPWVMALINVVVWGTLVAYIASLRRHFAPPSVTTDD